MPPKISTAKDALTQATLRIFWAPNMANAAIPVIAAVPFIKASPSLYLSLTGFRPTF